MTINSKQKKKMYTDIVISIFIIFAPIFFYFSLEVLIPLFYHHKNSQLRDYLLFVTAILGITGFLFILFRVIVRYFKMKFYASSTGLLIGKILALFVFPLLTLVVCQYIGPYISLGINFRSDSLALLIFTLVNRIFFIFPQINKKKIRLLLLFLRSITLFISAILFITALPFIPFVLLLVVFAIGFLFIGPYTMFIVSIKIYIEDLKYLRKGVPILLVILLSLIGLASFSIATSIELSRQKKSLDQAVEYVFNYDLSRPQTIPMDLDLLKKSLVNIDRINKRKLYIIDRYISLYFCTGGKLSREKIEAINQVFFQNSFQANIPFQDSSPGTSLRDFSFQSEFNSLGPYWESQIDLKIVNESDRQGEYKSHFTLPEDVFISDYYLVVDGVKKKGNIREKRTAIWIFNRIVSRRRDPGLLHYNSDNSLSLSVFPIIKDEVRETGFTLIHKKPFNFEFDDKIYKIGTDPFGNDYRTVESSHAVYLPADKKHQLHKVRRYPYLHFMIDYSEDVSDDTIEDYKSDLNNLISRFGKSNEYKITLIGNSITNIKSEKDLNEVFKKIRPAGRITSNLSQVFQNFLYF